MGDYNSVLSDTFSESLFLFRGNCLSFTRETIHVVFSLSVCCVRGAECEDVLLLISETLAALMFSGAMNSH